MAHYTHSGFCLSSRTHRSAPLRAQRKPCAINQSKLAQFTVTDIVRTSRRTLLTLLVGLGAGSAPDARANPPPSQGEPAPAVAFPVSAPTPTPQPDDPTVFTYDFASDVPCNLRVREYWSIINQQRPKTWQQIAQQIQTGNYTTLSMNLNVVPMADLRQAALHLPWALLQNSDYTAAVEAFKAYKNFDDHVKDLQRAAAAAAAFALAEPPQQAQQAQLAQQVQQAFILMSASLDGFLATVPARYTAALGLFQGRAASSSQPEPPPPQQPQQQQPEEQQPEPQP